MLLDNGDRGDLALEKTSVSAEQKKLKLAETTMLELKREHVLTDLGELGKIAIWEKVKEKAEEKQQ